MWTEPVRTTLTHVVLGLTALSCIGPAQAQGPLSAIDWLSDSVVMPAAQPRAPKAPAEPDVATSALPETITVTPLGAPSPDSVGLMSARRLDLPRDLWGNSPSATLVRQIQELDVPDLPALRGVFKSMLIAELAPPLDSAGGRDLFLARIDALLKLGDLDDAAELLDRAGRTQPEYFRRWFDISLLNGTEDRACARMRALPQISPTYGARIFCLARGGDWQAAALTLDTAKALDLISPEEDDLLARFLLADMSEGDNALLPPVRNPTPLVFSMYAAIGEPINTANLPLAFAHADLRPVTGWKARIAAAERLARMDAIAPERLIQVYTERKPAASGGAWDRVKAVQALLAALNRGDTQAVAQALPTVWVDAREPELQTAIAAALAERLAPVPLSGSAGDIALEVQLLSPRFAALGVDGGPESSDARQRFWLALAAGDPSETPAPGATAQALRDGFATPAPPAALQSMIDERRKGEALFRAITLFASGADGNLDDLQDAVALLNALGQEQVARQAALQLLILDAAP